MYDDVVTQGWYRIRPDRTRQRWIAARRSALLVRRRRDHVRRRARRRRSGWSRSGSCSARSRCSRSRAACRRAPARARAMFSRVRGFRRLFDEGDQGLREKFAEQHDIFSQVPAVRDRVRLHRQVGARVRRSRRASSSTPAGTAATRRSTRSCSRARSTTSAPSRPARCTRASRRRRARAGSAAASRAAAAGVAAAAAGEPAALASSRCGRRPSAAARPGRRRDESARSGAEPPEDEVGGRTAPRLGRAWTSRLDRRWLDSALDRESTCGERERRPRGRCRPRHRRHAVDRSTTTAACYRPSTFRRSCSLDTDAARPARRCDRRCRTAWPKTHRPCVGIFLAGGIPACVRCLVDSEVGFRRARRCSRDLRWIAFVRCRRQSRTAPSSRTNVVSSKTCGVRCAEAGSQRCRRRCQSRSSTTPMSAVTIST